MDHLDVELAIERMTAFLEDQLAMAGADCYVVGVSGGLDSAVAATLAVRAVGAEAVTGMILPAAPSDPTNIDDARTLVADLGIDLVDADIRPVVEAVGERTPFAPDEVAVGNLRARTRMLFLYLTANVRDGLVVGTTNRSEWLLGYFTKYGDGAADVRPLAGVYKTEMGAVATAIGVEERFVQKTPSAELWPGQTDEGELGASYETIDAILSCLVEDDGSVREAAARAGVPIEMATRFRRMMAATVHKRSQPPAAEIPR